MNGMRTDEALRGEPIAIEAPGSRVAALCSKIIAPNQKLLFFLFLLTLPLMNPWVRGDGVGYYAYVRSALIDHDLHFENDYLQANESFVLSKVDAQGKLLPSLYTKTGYVKNHFSVGPAILWAPALLAVHEAVLMASHLGARISADGYSRPYLLAMALTTAVYGFLSLLLAFQIARKYFDEKLALLATIGIWMASSLPVYMYFNPSWSHAHSAFAVALFLWYWERTRDGRTTGQWTILGLLAGLMGNVYYPNAILLIFPALEVGRLLLVDRQRTGATVVPIHKLASDCGVFLLTFVVSLLPTFATRQIIYGNPFETGYPPVWTWHWASPVFLKVLFSSDHGMFSWTPVLFLAVIGLPFLFARDRLLGGGALLSFLAYYYFIASYPDWDGLSSFGNRFFVSLTPIFILGLAALLNSLSSWMARPARALGVACTVIGLLIVWNVGLIFQWGTHMIPARGPISWSATSRQQVYDVPLRITHSLETYFTRRGEMMQHIEQQDIEQQQLEEKKGE
jgi:hypothetical protein